MSVALVKGGNTPLTKAVAGLTRVYVAVGWSGAGALDVDARDAGAGHRGLGRVDGDWQR